MFIQLENVENLEISKKKDSEAKSISFNCVVHDDLFDKDKKVKIIIPQSILNAKIIKETIKEKSNIPNVKFSTLKGTLRLDFEMLGNTDEIGNWLYQIVEEIN